MWVPNTQSEYDVHVIIDVSVCEVFVNDGAYAFTNTFYLQYGVASTLEVTTFGVDADVYDVYKLEQPPRAPW
jgi:sucrose-6-phosphate hydrolase SacC (GH32 family)